MNSRREWKTSNVFEVAVKLGSKPEEPLFWTLWEVLETDLPAFLNVLQFNEIEKYEIARVGSKGPVNGEVLTKDRYK